MYYMAGLTGNFQSEKVTPSFSAEAYQNAYAKLSQEKKTNNE